MSTAGWRGANPSDYSDAIQRIIENHVDPTSTSRQEMINDLLNSGATGDERISATDHAQWFTQAVTSEEDLVAALDAAGEVPSRSKVQQVVRQLDEEVSTPNQLLTNVANNVQNNIVTTEDIAGEFERPTDRPTFREDIEETIDRASEGKEFGLVGSDRETVTTELAREQGAPSRSDYQQARSQNLVQNAEFVSPEEEGISSRTTTVAVLRDSSGEAIAATGGDSRDRAAIAEQRGIEDFGSLAEAEEQIGVEGSGSTVDLTLAGRKVGEVSVE